MNTVTHNNTIKAFIHSDQVQTCLNVGLSDQRLQLFDQCSLLIDCFIGPLHNGCVSFCFFWQIIRTTKVFFKLLTGREYFHTECKYRAAKKRTLHFSDPANKHTNQIVMAVRSRRHVCISQQKHKRWLMSSSPVSLSTKCCLTNDTQDKKTTISDNSWQSISHQFGFVNGEQR